MEKRIKNIYETTPGGLSTVGRLQNELRKQSIHISTKKLQNYMRKWQAFTKFKTKYKRSNIRDRAIVTAPNQLFQIDLAIMPKYRYHIALLIWFIIFSFKVLFRYFKII